MKQRKANCQPGMRVVPCVVQNMQQRVEQTTVTLTPKSYKHAFALAVRSDLRIHLTIHAINGQAEHNALNNAFANTPNDVCILTTVSSHLDHRLCPTCPSLGIAYYGVYSREVPASSQTQACPAKVATLAKSFA